MRKARYGFAPVRLFVCSAIFSKRRMLILWILGFSILGSIGAIAGAALLLALAGRDTGQTGALSDQLCDGHPACCRLSGHDSGRPASRRPHARFLLPYSPASSLFFILEKLVLWRHCHDSGCEVHGQAAPLILIGDAFHNFVDGVVIAAAFLTSVPLGVATAIAVIAHEVPQEVGDFAISAGEWLLEKSRR